MDAGLQKVNDWFDGVNRALPEGVSIVPGPNYPAGMPRPMPNEIRELLVQADAAIEKSRGLLKEARDALTTHPATSRVSALLAEITDLLGD